MKKIICFFVAAMVIVLSGCKGNEEEEEIWIVDWNPVIVYVYAEDAHGNDLIKSDMPDMTISFKGKTYPVKPQKEVEGRYYLPTFYGFYFQEASEYSKDPVAKNRLVFGEIDGALDMDEDMILTWPDGTTNTIHYHCSDHKDQQHATCNRWWKLDGKEHKDCHFKFIK